LRGVSTSNGHHQGLPTSILLFYELKNNLRMKFFAKIFLYGHSGDTQVISGEIFRASGEPFLC
jgi:hypothetical protein